MDDPEQVFVSDDEDDGHQAEEDDNDWNDDDDDDDAAVDDGVAVAMADGQEAVNHVQQQQQEQPGEAQDGDDRDDAEHRHDFNNLTFDSIEHLCPRDPRRMELSNEERQWAMAIKAAIESSPEIDNLSDFKYAQYALVDQDDIQSAVDRALHYQFYREQYRIMDTFECGSRLLHKVVDMFPEMILCITYYSNTDGGNYICVSDLAAVDESLVITEEDSRVFTGLGYYLFHLLSPDFMAIRNGIILISECGGYNWKNLSLKTRRKFWMENFSVYPINLKQVKYFHTGLFANLAISIIKRLLPEELSCKLQSGCQFTDRLNHFYNIPSVEVAQQRVLERMDACLRRRYENEESFRL